MVQFRNHLTTWDDVPHPQICHILLDFLVCSWVVLLGKNLTPGNEQMEISLMSIEARQKIKKRVDLEIIIVANLF
jgi:hypothetical protein